ncbi:MAG: tRNA (adenosine(37)-N6)-dimethylallyltransferase MiaA [Patescibacteria group bacterium]
MNKLLVILGPTATGKTDLALSLAKKFNGELVSCDSRQVYRGLDIGTGKISNLKSQMSNVKIRRGWWEIDGVNIWMYDVVNPRVQYTVADYVKKAEKIVKEVHNRDKLPIIVGGTGLYIKALAEGLPNLAVPIDFRKRKNLEKVSLISLQEKLKKVSSQKWQSLNASDKQNPRRLVRAIELATSDVPVKFQPPSYEVLKIGLTAPRDFLYKRVDEGVFSRIKQGMVEETKKLHKKGLTFKRMRELGLEYGILADYLERVIKDIDSLTEIMQNRIHGFVRRQLTYFKKEKRIHWFDISEKGYIQKVEKKVSKWYYRT